MRLTGAQYKMSNKILPYVYKLIHKETGQYYFGYRSNNKVSSSEDLGIYYFSSSKEIKPIFCQFHKEIVAEFFDGKDAWVFEQQLIGEHFNDSLLINRSYYRDGSRIFSTAGRKRTNDEKERISKTKTGVKRKWIPSEAQIERMKESRRGYVHSSETRQKISDSNLGRKVSEETRYKISDSMKGNTPWNKGTPITEAAREKLIKTKSENKRPAWNKGLKMPDRSDEERLKRSESRKGKKFYCNRITGERILCLPEDCPNGWTIGKS